MASDADSQSEIDEEEERRLEEEFNKSLSVKRTTTTRGSVVFAESNVPKADWKPPVYPKDTRQREVIVSSVVGSFLFSGFRPETTNTVVDAFKGPMHVKKGDVVIREGASVGTDDPGVFVLEEGWLDAYQAGPGQRAPGALLCSYKKRGQIFGDLAVLYSCPRAASVVAQEASVLWSLDRDTFNNCVKGANIENRAKLDRFLASVQILSGLSDEDRSRICDVATQKNFFPGERIIRAGEEGLEFFMVMNGSAQAKQDGRPVQDYGPGDYFGELALLSDQRRQVDVYAGDAEGAAVAVLESASFKRLLGPLRDLMAERAQSYQPLAVGGGAGGIQAPIAIQAVPLQPQQQGPPPQQLRPLQGQKALPGEPVGLKATTPMSMPFGWLCCSCGVKPANENMVM